MKKQRKGKHETMQNKNTISKMQPESTRGNKKISDAGSKKIEGGAYVGRGIHPDMLKRLQK